jgi:hypothetical protein
MYCCTAGPQHPHARTDETARKLSGWDGIGTPSDHTAGRHNAWLNNRIRIVAKTDDCIMHLFLVEPNHSLR